MSETGVHKVAWRRGSHGPLYVGAASRGAETISLTGRDPILGIDVALSIPIEGIAYVGVTEPEPASGSGDADGGRLVVLDPLGSAPIHLRPIGGGRLDVHLLARALGPTPASALLVEGGRT
jgi:hypothetical protein